MPAAAAAALASAAFTAAGGVAAGALAVAAATIAYGVGFAVVSLGISFAVGSIMGAVFKPRTANSFSSEAQGRSQVVRSNVQPRNLIYGRVMTSGPLVYATSTDGEGKKNLYMHLVIALADHECDAVEQVYLGEDSVGAWNSSGYVTGGKFQKRWGTSEVYSATLSQQTSIALNPGLAIRRVTSVVATVGSGENRVDTVPSTVNWEEGGLTVNVAGIDPAATSITMTYEALRSEPMVRVKVHLGAADQAVDADLEAEVPEWTWKHRLRGVCYIYVRLKYDADFFPNGLPNVKALVRGKRVFNPRDGSTLWTDNWAFCVYDYLRDERGLGCADSDVDLQSVLTAANVCDELVPIGDGRYDRRYRCNGVVMSDKSPRDSLAEMVTAGGGVVTITGGVFRVFAGAYDIPTITLTESDLHGSVKVRPRVSRKDLFNRVKGTFINPANNWQPSDFPVVANPTYAAQDGEVIDRDIELPFTTDAVQAQRLAKIILERSRQGISVDFPAKMTAFQVTAYSTVMVTLAKFGWAAKPFRVMSWKMSDDGGIDLVLNEEAAAVYDWNYGNATVTDPAPDTNLPDPFSVESLGQITLNSGEQHLILSNTGQVISRIFVQWPAVSEASVSQTGRIEVAYKAATSSLWTPLASVQADTTSLYISPVEDGTAYVVRGRVVSGLGVRSKDWSYSPVHVVVGKLDPPANLTGLSLTAINGFANLTWDAATNLDVKVGGQARIRHTTDTLQPSWGSAIDIGGYIAGGANSAQLPLLEGVYLAKWIDSTGHESPSASMVITTAPSLSTLNFFATITEQPAFSGAKSGIVFDPALNGIKLIGAGLIDDQGIIDATGLWDSQPSVDSLGTIDDVVGQGGWGLIDSLGGIVDVGTYTFAGQLDLGSTEKSRLTAAIDTVSFDTADSVDERFDLIDSWLSVDGNLVNDTSVSLFVRTTNDDPAGAAVWTAWQRFSMGDYEARAFQWKVELTSASATHNVLVTGLSVTVDMPDRRESGRDVVSAVGATPITYGKAFRVSPVVGITAQNMAQGDYFVVNKGSGLPGFTITFFNASNVAISRRFDWDAVAY